MNRWVSLVKALSQGSVFAGCIESVRALRHRGDVPEARVPGNARVVRWSDFSLPFPEGSPCGLCAGWSRLTLPNDLASSSKSWSRLGEVQECYSVAYRCSPLGSNVPL